MLQAGYKNLLPTLFFSCLMAMNKKSRGSAEVNIAETVFTAEQLVMYARFTNQSTQTVFLEEEVVRVLEFTYVLYDIPLPTITNIEFIDHEEQLTMNFGVSTVFVKTVFLEEEVVRILKFISVFPGITLRHTTNIGANADEDLELHSGVSNVLTPIATQDVFVTAEPMILPEEGAVISEDISESFDVSQEYVATVETKAGEEHLVEYAIVMLDFHVIKEPHASITFETVFKKEQTRY